MPPLVSIVCITYNHEKYIRQCLDGILSQRTTFPFEIIVSDDCSTDSTREIIEEYLQTNEGRLIRDVSPENNLGVIRNWRHVHENANGKYIAYCEGDDYWISPDKLQKQVDFLETHPDCGLCVTDFKYQFDTNTSLFPSSEENRDRYRPNSFFEHLFAAGYIGPMTWVYRNDVFRIFDYSNPYILDATLALSLDFFAVSKVHYLDDVTAVYRIHNNSVTNQFDPIKEFIYSKGVFSIQLEYALKYKCSKETLLKLRFQGYAERMSSAIYVEDEGFVREALVFYHEQGMEMGWFVQKCREDVGYRKQYEKVCHSFAYRLGKKILSPVRYLRGLSFKSSK